MPWQSRMPGPSQALGCTPAPKGLSTGRRRLRASGSDSNCMVRNPEPSWRGHSSTGGVNLQPILNAPLAIQLHFVTVVPAFFLGAWQLLASRKGSPSHRLIGKIYLTLMSITAVAAFFIPSFTPFSFSVGAIRLGLIHLFIPLTINGIYPDEESASHRQHQGAQGVDARHVFWRSGYRGAADVHPRTDHVSNVFRLRSETGRLWSLDFSLWSAAQARDESPETRDQIQSRGDQYYSHGRTPLYADCATFNSGRCGMMRVSR